MTGASISPEVKTFSVDYFQNKSLLVVPYLSTLFTEKLKTYMRTKTSLKEMTDNNGDIRFSGEIVGYYQKPSLGFVTVPRAALNTISIPVFPIMQTTI